MSLPCVTMGWSVASLIVAFLVMTTFQVVFTNRMMRTLL